MIKLWHRVKYYYCTHDGIEMLLFTCVLSSFVWIAYHFVVGVIQRIGL